MPAEHWAEAEHELEQRRRGVVSALTAAWGSPQTHSFEPDFERIVAGEHLPTVIEDLALFSIGHQADGWRRGKSPARGQPSSSPRYWLLLPSVDHGGRRRSRTTYPTVSDTATGIA
jgi:hypothetical protein